MALALQTLTMVPYLSKLIAGTDSGYPDEIHIGHNLISIAEFRKWRGERDASWMHKMIGSFLCFGNGGSFALDALLQNRNGIVTSAKTAKYWTLSTFLIYCSPRDIVYKTMVTPRHPVRVASRILDAIDDMTTVCNTVEYMHVHHRQNPLGPYIASLALKKGGALFRYFEAKGRGVRAEYPFAFNDNSTKEALLFTALYMLLGGRSKARGQAKWLTTMLYIAVAVADEFGVSVLERVYHLMDAIGHD
eukprot:gene23025-248_t